jgi:spore coat protein A, manganese oxidase
MEMPPGPVVPQTELDPALLPKPFTRQFSVPKIAVPVYTDADTDYYAMDMLPVVANIIPGKPTTMWGYNGEIPAPTIDVMQGRKVVVRHSNHLPNHPFEGYNTHTSVHLHGSASLPQYDGYASDLTHQHEYKDYHYPNFQNARTLWYHDHGIHQTSTNAYMGLAGMYRMFDPQERALPLPKGKYDVPLIVADRTFDSNGQLFFEIAGNQGQMGNVNLVNGVPWPVMQVERRKYRFRILNGSISRSYRWQLNTRDPFVIVATDGGLVPKPISVTNFRHAPAERYEVIIDFAKYALPKAGRAPQRIILQNLSNKNNDDFLNTNIVMAFDIVANATDTTNNTIPAVLAGNNDVMNLTAAQSVGTAEMVFHRSNGEWKVNDRTWQDVIDSGFTLVEANPKLNDVQIWTFTNTSGGWFHPVHVHLVDFKILSRNGQPPMPHERGPKDVVYVGEGETVKVIARYGPQIGKYMIHCHNLAHEDHDMMVQFEVEGPLGAGGGPDPITTAPAAALPAPIGFPPAP